MKPRVGRSLYFSANLLNLSMQRASCVYKYYLADVTYTRKKYLWKANFQPIPNGNQVLEKWYKWYKWAFNTPRNTDSVIANKARCCSKVNDWCCCRATLCKCMHVSHDIMLPLPFLLCCKLKVNIRYIALHFLDLFVGNL